MKHVFLVALPTLLSALMLAACGKPADNTQAPADAANAQNATAPNAAAEVAKLPKSAREAVLFRAIRDAGLSCQDVVESEHAGDTTWRAKCDDGNWHLITVNPNGLATVVSRTSR